MQLISYRLHCTEVSVFFCMFAKSAKNFVIHQESAMIFSSAGLAND